MLTTSSVTLNIVYVVVGGWLFIASLRVLNRLFHLHAEQEVEIKSGVFPLRTRRVPYSAQVATLLFAFAALLQVAIYLVEPSMRATHGDMPAMLLFVVHIKNACFLGGGFAAASHKRYIYLDSKPGERGKPPRGKAAGRARETEPWTLPTSSAKRPPQIHRRVVQESYPAK